MIRGGLAMKAKDSTEYVSGELLPDLHHHSHVNSHPHRYKKSVLNRLARSTGHLRSISGMVERECDCSEILIQLAAVRSEINGICAAILKEHIDHCIVDAVSHGDTDSIDELNKAISALIKYR